MRIISKDGKIVKKKRLDHMVFTSVLLVSSGGGGVNEDQSRWFILEIGYNSIMKVNIRHIFAIIRPFQFKGVGIDLTLRIRLFCGIYVIIYIYQFLIYHTIAQLYGLTSRIIIHKSILCQQCYFKISNTTNITLEIFCALTRF